MTPDLKSPFVWLPRTPFGTLVAYFLKRMFSSGDEEASGGMSLGLGVVVALLASPGAFASLFLLDKYSTLLQWLRGMRHFDFYRASAADEYFFVVLSMTITGLVMLMRWNRLFPDRRDFANLAALPIPIHHIFLANSVALAGLALVFAIDINVVSCFFFPAFVTSSDGRLSPFLTVGFAHLATVFAATLFSFCSLFALVGLLTLLLPAHWLRPVSVAVRILLAVVLMMEFFSNLLIQLFAGRMPGAANAYVHWLPSFWFVGVYETLIGIANPFMRQMAHRAWTALALSVFILAASYALCYRRHFLRLAESFDTLAGNRHGTWFRMPEKLKRLLFRSPFEEACLLFAFRAITRSEKHVMFLGAFLGIGVVIAAGSVTQSLAQIPLLMAFFLIGGLRIAFDIPAVISSNWIFRAAANRVTPSPNAVATKLMLFAVLPFQLLPVAPPAGMLLNIAFSVLAVQWVLLNFEHIPFTYVMQIDSRKMVVRFIFALVSILMLVPFLIWLERWAAAAWWRYTFVAVCLAAAWFDLRRRRREKNTALTFEERSSNEFELLNLA